MKTAADSDSASERAFRVMFEAEIGFVSRVLRRHGIKERDLPDACQETFLVVHRRLCEFERRSSLRTWIYGIAMRVAAGQRRKAHLSREQLDGDLPEQSSSPLQLQNAEQRQLLQQVEQALSCTTEERREVFALYELEGMTMKEVSEALAIPENTAFSRLYSARADVRAQLEREGRSARIAGGLR